MSSRVVRLSAQDSRFSRPLRFSPSDQCLTVRARKPQGPYALRTKRPESRTQFTLLTTVGVSSAGRLRYPATQIAMNSSPVSAVLLRARVAVTHAVSRSGLAYGGGAHPSWIAGLAQKRLHHLEAAKGPFKWVEGANFFAVSQNHRIGHGDVHRPKQVNTSRMIVGRFAAEHFARSRRAHFL